MENIEFSIDKKIRLKNSKVVNYYYTTTGIIVLICGLFIFVKNVFQSEFSYFGGILVLTGVVNIIQGKLKKEIFWTRHRLIMNSETITIKIALERNVIKLKSISYVKILNQKLEIGLRDFVKTLDCSWMTPDDFESFVLRIKEYCTKNRIEIE